MISHPRRFLLTVLLAGTLTGCATLPADVERKESHALTGTEATRLGRLIAPLATAHPGESGFRPLRSGVDALVARLALAEGAERSLDVQYYIWHDDLTGRHFANALLRAADRGVRVRVLLDDVGVGADDEVLLALSAHPSLEIRLFNPVVSRSFRALGMLGDMPRLNRRMHNKAFVADNQAAILGGRNIGDEYFGAHGEVAFGDLDVLTVGAGVAAVSAAFDRFWNSSAAYPVAALTGRRGAPADLAALRATLAEFVEAQRGTPYVVAARAELAERFAGRGEGLFWGKAHVLFDDPDKIGRAPDDAEGRLLPQLGHVAGAIEKEILIVSPYFVPGAAGVKWLRGLAARGVRVTVLTNSLAATDVAAVHAGYQRYREALLDAGVRLYELKPEAIERGRESERQGGLSGSRASLHAKTFAFDRKSVFIGSMNLDPRSIGLNTEIGVLCESPAMAAEIAGTLERKLATIAWRLERIETPTGEPAIVWVETTADGERRLAQEPGVGEWLRFSLWFLGLFPVESQL